jgi:PAB-dependent poly(A)-specific ribonuclease subunit 2
MPAIISINCNIETERDKRFWQSQQRLLLEATAAQETSEDPPAAESAAAAGGSAPSAISIPQSEIPCRFGGRCTRVACKYLHESKASDTSRIPKRSWIPSEIGLKRVDDKKIKCVEIEDEVDIFLRQLFVH